MARAVIRDFSPELVQLADLAKAISHPARLQILRILAARRACVCGEIVEDLPLSQSTVSQHLKELKRVGLIQGEVSGPRTCYCLDERVLRQAWSALNRLFQGIGCCGLQDLKEKGE